MDKFDIVEAEDMSRVSVNLIRDGERLELEADPVMQKEILEEISWCKWWGKTRLNRKPLINYIVYGYRGRVTIRQYSALPDWLKVVFFPHLIRDSGGGEWYHHLASFETDDLTLGGVLDRLESNLKSQVDYTTIEKGDTATLMAPVSDGDPQVNYSGIPLDVLNHMLTCHHPVEEHPPVPPEESDQMIVSLILKWALEFEHWAVSADKSRVLVRTSDGRILFTVMDQNNPDSIVFVDSYPNSVSTPGNRFRKRYRFRVKKDDLKRLSDALVNQMGKKVSFQDLHDGHDTG
jgi:hypothetical protein